MRDTEKTPHEEIIPQMSALLAGDGTDADKLARIDHTRSKTVANGTLRSQAGNNTKELSRHPPGFDLW